MATQVDFYLLTLRGDDARQAFACKLTSKAHGMGARVHLRVADAQALQGLDTLLWTFSDDSFVAHDVLPDPNAMAAVTLAVADQPVPAAADVCINLTDSPVTDACPRVAEILSDDDAVKAAGRDRYASYRERGCELNTHQIGNR